MTENVRGQLTLVAKLCSNTSCPAVYRRDDGTVVVQGYAVAAAEAGLEVPAGELLVEIPADLLREAARTLE